MPAAVYVRFQKSQENREKAEQARTERLARDEVRAETAGLIVAFASAVEGQGAKSVEAMAILAAANDAAAEFYGPLLEAFMVHEGNWFFLDGVDYEHSSVGGSAFGATAQQLMASPLPDGCSWATSPKNEFQFPALGHAMLLVGFVYLVHWLLMLVIHLNNSYDQIIPNVQILTNH